MNNKINTPCRVVSLILTVLLVSACSSLARRAPPAINFTGIWNISREMSGNPTTLPGIEAPMPAARGQSGAGILARLESRRLRIRQTATETTITYDNGLKETYDWGKFAYRNVKSGWRDKHFVIRRPGPGGHLLVRRYILSDRGDSITVVTVFNKMAMTQFYELDKKATKSAFGRLVSVKSQDS